MLPVLDFIDRYLIELFIWIIVASAVLSWLVLFRVVRSEHTLVRTLLEFFYRITEPFLAPIRRLLPPMGNVDVSPVILILILIFIRVVVIRGWLMPLFK
jgi:YggT family protein